MATPTLKNGLKAEKTKVRFFDLDKFKNDSVEINFSYKPISDVNEAKAALSDEQILAAANDVLKSAAMKDARKAAKENGTLPANAASIGKVSAFVKPFSAIFPFDQMPANNKEEKAARKKAILESVKAIPVIYDGLRASAGLSDDDEDDDETVEE